MELDAMKTTMNVAMDAKVESLRNWFLSLQQRERLIIVAGTLLVLIAAIYILGFAPLSKAVNERRARVMQKQDDLAWMQSVVSQVSVANLSRPQANADESLVVTIANTAAQSNISSALTGQSPSGANEVRVRFEGVDFDAMVLWLGRLQQLAGIHVSAAEINRTATPGRVNADLTLARGG
jgi:type II secretory pathway component PulM